MSNFTNLQLYNLYWVDNLSTYKIGKLFNCSADKILYEMKKLGITRRKSGMGKGSYKPNVIVIKSCKYCDSEFESYRCANRIYCSGSCRSKHLNRRGKGKKKLLLNNNKVFVKRVESNTERIEALKKCKYCDKTFIASYATKVYCSDDCRSKGISLTLKNRNINKGKIPWNKGLKTGPLSERHKEKIALGRVAYMSEHKGPWMDTNIERAMEKALILKSIVFEKQQRFGRWLVDFFIKPNIVIECDGDYWHSQKKNQIRDKIKDKDLIALGNRVYRFSEQKLLDNATVCLNSIPEFVVAKV